MTVPAIAASARLSSLHVVGNELQVSAVKLEALAMARSHGLEADAIDRLGLIMTELAGNIVRHAGSGQIILRRVGESGHGCIEILALDKGSGIADMTRAMRGGVTPAGGVPIFAGLVTVRRLADFFDIYSHAGCGTAVVTHVGSPPGHDSVSRCAAEAERHGCVGVVCVPIKGEEECGDDWAVDDVAGRTTVLLVDGLGHGPGAAVAARSAISVFAPAAATTPESMMGAMHAALRPTRGAALSVAVIDRTQHTVRFCGVGNVDGRVVTPDDNRHMVPQNGIVGHTMPRVHLDTVPWPQAGRLVMHSDGVSSRWRLANYPGLVARHPALIAGVLFRDFARARDDATVLVLRDTVITPPA